MGFGTQQQLGNRTGITNQTSLTDFFGGGGGNINLPGLGQDGQQNQLFTLLQSLLGGQGGFQAPGGSTSQPPIGITPQPPVGIGQRPPFGGPLTRPPTRPPIGFPPPPGQDFGGNINPIGIGQPQPIGQSLDVMPRGFGNTPLTQLSNPFGSLINQSFFR